MFQELCFSMSSVIALFVETGWVSFFFLAAWNGAVTHVGHPDAFVAQTFRMAYCHLCLGGGPNFLCDKPLKDFWKKWKTKMLKEKVEKCENQANRQVSLQIK